MMAGAYRDRSKMPEGTDETPSLFHTRSKPAPTATIEIETGPAIAAGQGAIALDDCPDCHPDDGTDQERCFAFLAFHESNPKVYKRLSTMARTLDARGHTRAPIKMLYETIRFESLVSGATPSLPNEYTAAYARLIAAKHPDLGHLFDLRESAFDSCDIDWAQV